MLTPEEFKTYNKVPYQFGSKEHAKDRIKTILKTIDKGLKNGKTNIHLNCGTFPELDKLIKKEMKSYGWKTKFIECDITGYVIIELTAIK